MSAYRQELDVPGMGPPVSHYCDAVASGGFLFVSGIVATDENQVLVGEGDAAAQAACVFERLERVLAAAGAGFGDIVKITIFLTDIDDRSAVNPLRRACFGAARPASTLVEVSRLVIPGARIEVEAVARLKTA